MKKLLTYCLWGNNPTYNVGAYRNAEQAQTFFPDWICRYYVGSNTPEKTINTLKEYPNTEVIEMGVEGTPTAMLWRFESIDDPDVEIMMPRDTDCRFGHREVEAVKDWMASGKGFHIMRDHPYHATAMMGGMWGMRKTKREWINCSLPDMFGLLRKRITSHTIPFLVQRIFQRKIERRGKWFTSLVNV